MEIRHSTSPLILHQSQSTPSPPHSSPLNLTTPHPLTPSPLTPSPSEHHQTASGGCAGGPGRRSPPWCCEECCGRIPPWSPTGPAPTPRPTPSPTSSAWWCRLPSPSSHMLSHRAASCGDITITTLTLTTHTLTPPCLALTPSPHSPLSHGMETPHLPQSERDVVWSLLLPLVVGLVGSLPVMETLIPPLLDFL